MIMKKVFSLLIFILLFGFYIDAQKNDKLQNKDDSALNSKKTSNTLKQASDSLNTTNGEFKGLKWYTIEEAEKLCKEKPKKIMIDVFTSWCGWCKVMDKNTFTNPIIAKYLNDNFYTVKFNAESADTVVFNGQKFINENPGYRLSHQFAVALLKGKMSFPSIAFFSEKLEFLGSIPGYRKPEEMEVILNWIAQDKFKTMTFEEFQKSFTGHIKANPGE